MINLVVLGTAATSSNATTGQTTYGCGSHTVRFDYARANQHRRTEYGECIFCGARHERVIEWGNGNKSAQQWRRCAPSGGTG